MITVSRMATCAIVALALAIHPLPLAAAGQVGILLPADGLDSAGCLSALSSALPGDVNGDGYVNIGDLQLLVATWARAFGDPGFNTEADFNCDAYVNVGDLQVLVFNWGAHP